MTDARLPTLGKFACVGLLALIAATTSLPLAGSASADGYAALDRDFQVSHCVGTPPQACGKPVSLQFSNTSPFVEISVSRRVKSGDCPQLFLNTTIDGKQVDSDYGMVFPLALGVHTFTVDGVCVTGTLPDWGAHIVIANVEKAGVPAPPNRQPAPNTPNAPIASTATVTDDVDLYQGPDGTGGTSGFLPAGKTVRVVAPCKSDAWCNLVDPKGSAWGQFLQNN